MQDIIKVLVVDDSALMRTLVSEILSADPAIEVIGTARTGLEAISKASKLSPDVVTLDIEMPELGGLEALRHIMRKSPTKVIMLSGLSSADVTYEALSSGAVDFIVKPTGPFSPNISEIAGELLSKIHISADVDVGALPTDGTRKEVSHAAPASKRTGVPSKVVAIGASTGGPAALERVISGLAADLPAAYLVVQHLPVGFSDSFTRRLARLGPLEVRPGETGDRVLSGVVYVAPAGHHMTVANRPSLGPVIHLDQGPAIARLRPAADRTMESAADVYGDRTIGVLLTGMGSDGALGMKMIKEAGGFTIAQDEKTSVVYGMPRAAIERGVVDRVVPLHKIASEIRKAASREDGVSNGR